MNGSRSVSVVGLLLILYFLSFEASAESFLPTLQIDRLSPLAVSVASQGKSYSLSLPNDFMSKAEGVYDDVYIEDLNGDGVGELVFRLGGGSSNACSKVLYYKAADRTLAELDFGDEPLCNFKVRRNYIVSSYRDGAVWKENVYRIQGGEVKYFFSDSCVGCGEVKRRKYHSDRSFTRLLVSDDVDFERRVPLVTKISSFRANIFTSPEISKRTNMYLIKVDEITLLDFFKDDEGWIEFRFSGVVTTEGWLRCSDLEYCDRSTATAEEPSNV